MLADEVSSLPFKRVQSSKYFRNMDGYWKAVTRGTPGAERINFGDLDPLKIQLPSITLVRQCLMVHRKVI